MAEGNNIHLDMGMDMAFAGKKAVWEIKALLLTLKPEDKLICPLSWTITCSHKVVLQDSLYPKNIYILTSVSHVLGLYSF